MKIMIVIIVKKYFTIIFPGLPCRAPGELREDEVPWSIRFPESISSRSRSSELFTGYLRHRTETSLRVTGWFFDAQYLFQSSARV